MAKETEEIQKETPLVKKDCGCGCNGAGDCEGHEKSHVAIGVAIIVVVVGLIVWAGWKYKWIDKLKS